MEESFFSDLVNFRVELASFTLPKAKKRLELERVAESKQDKSLHFAAVGSVPCDSRLPMGISIDNLTNTVAVAGWSNELSIWSMQGEKLNSFHPHTDKIQCVDTNSSLYLTGGFDSKVVLSGSSTTTYSSHKARVNSVLFSQLSSYFLSCSHDMTWKLWSIDRQSPLLSQAGHGRGIYSISQHPDGSLLCSGDLSGIAALWDLRTGKTLMTFKDHLKKILDCKFAPNGFNLITASEDNTSKVWDLRKKSLLYTIPAHSKLVSCLAVSESFIFTGSYDGCVKVWRLDDFSLVQVLSSDAKVTDLDLDLTGDVMVSSHFDRTFKIWTGVYEKR